MVGTRRVQTGYGFDRNSCGAEFALWVAEAARRLRSVSNRPNPLDLPPHPLARKPACGVAWRLALLHS